MKKAIEIEPKARNSKNGWADKERSCNYEESYA